MFDELNQIEQEIKAKLFLLKSKRVKQRRQSFVYISIRLDKPHKDKDIINHLSYETKKSPKLK